MQRNTHIVDILFILALICVFAVSALFVVLSGADVYSDITEQAGGSYDARTSLLYIAQKVRSADEKNAVRTDSVDGEPAIVLTSVYDGAAFETWIFCSRGSLREVMVARGMSVAGYDGQELMQLNSMDASIENGLLSVTVDKDGDTRSIALAPRCGSEGVS